MPARSELIINLIYEGSIANINYSISNAARSSHYVTGPRIITSRDRARDEADVPEGHRVGKFTSEWMQDAGPALPVQGHPPHEQCRKIEEVSEKLRGVMAWIAKNKLVDKAQN